MNELISIIIPVKNDRRIKNTLESIFTQQGVTRFEVIVVDSSPGTLDDISEEYKGKVKWIKYISKQKNKRSTVSQINYGIERSMGSILVFIDADCVAEQRWLSELVQPILGENEQFVAGNIKSLKNASQLDQIWIKNSKKKYVDNCPNMNSAFRKTLISNIGIYDEIEFNYGWDMDYSWRVIDHGFKIRFVKEAIVFHDWGNLKAEVKRNFFYGKAKVTLYKKHKDRLKTALSTDPYAIKYPILIVAVPFLMNPIVLLLWLYLVIKDLFMANPLIVFLSNFSYGFGLIAGILLLIRDSIFRNNNV
jgi:glycosyltransferase involved in cell wall biosynthesis